MEDWAKELALEIAAVSMCICGGTGLLDGHDVFKREPVCNCPVQIDDFENFFHTEDCDTVPCPFCALLGESRES